LIGLIAVLRCPKRDADRQVGRNRVFLEPKCPCPDSVSN
jgi:hypothetical protein